MTTAAEDAGRPAEEMREARGRTKTREGRQRSARAQDGHDASCSEPHSTIAAGGANHDATHDRMRGSADPPIRRKGKAKSWASTAVGKRGQSGINAAADPAASAMARMSFRAVSELNAIHQWRASADSADWAARSTEKRPKMERSALRAAAVSRQQRVGTSL